MVLLFTFYFIRGGFPAYLSPWPRMAGFCQMIGIIYFSSFANDPDLVNKKESKEIAEGEIYLLTTATASNSSSSVSLAMDFFDQSGSCSSG